MPLRAVEKLLISLQLLVKTEKRDIALVSTKLVTSPFKMKPWLFRSLSFILDKLSETLDSAGDFRVFTYDPLARYPAEWVAVDSIIGPTRIL
jgi:hypothetical protein